MQVVSWMVTKVPLYVNCEYLQVVNDVVGVIVHPDESVERFEVPAVLRRHSFPRHHEVAARRRPHGGHGWVVRLNLTPCRWGSRELN